MMGVLITLDAYNCRNTPKGAQQLLEWALQAAKEAGMHPVETLARHFSHDEWQEEMGDSAITLIVPLTESHLAIHTWPHYAFASVDLYTCGAFEPALRAVEIIKHCLGPKKSDLNFYQRGKHVKKED